MKGFLFFPMAVVAVAVAIAHESQAASSLDEALDLDGQNLQTTGVSAWTSQASGAYDGVDVAVSSPLPDEASAQFTVAVSGPDTLSFWWRVSSEEDYDFLQCSLNGTVQREISGDTGWMEEIIVLPEGLHTLTWAYVKDESEGEGEDRGWVDRIRFASRTVPAPRYPAQAGLYEGRPFEIQPESTASGATFALVGSPPAWLQLDSTTGALSGTPSAPGTYSVAITASNAKGTSEPQTITIEVVTLGDGLASTPGQWQWEGSAPWSSQTVVSHEGGSALQAGTIDHGQASVLKRPVTGPAIVTFWWRVDSEESHDDLAFLIDGEVARDGDGAALAISGLVDWEMRAAFVPEGEHVIAWRYRKDDVNIDGADTAWLDGLALFEDDDPDADGLTTLVEAALGMDWLDPGTDSLELPWEEDGKLTWRLTRAAPVAGISPLIEISYDLKTWTETPLTILTNTPNLITVQESVPNASFQKFIRVRAIASLP